MRTILSRKMFQEVLVMALNKVEICGVNTSRLPILSEEEKTELFRRIKQGDKEARELYIKGNLRKLEI